MMGHASVLRGLRGGMQAVSDLGSKSWRERIADAEARTRWPWWRRAIPRLTWMCFPFTNEDIALMGSRESCMAAEQADAFGLNENEHGLLWCMGDRAYAWMRRGNVKKTVRALDSIEDCALEFKRRAS